MRRVPVQRWPRLNTERLPVGSELPLADVRARRPHFQAVIEYLHVHHESLLDTDMNHATVAGRK